jgi:hypothetical protein
MNDYVYRWNIRPEHGFTLELSVTAQSVVVARREVRRFMVDHEGYSWTIESVSRESTHAPYAFLAQPKEKRN